MGHLSGDDLVSAIEGHAVLPAGPVIQFKWKCWTTSAGQVLWKLLTPLEQQFETVRLKTVFDLTSYLSRHKLLFGTLLEQLGSTYDEHVLPSRLALQRRDSADAGSRGPIKAEYTCSTKALLAIFVWYSMGLRRDEQKDRAKALLRGFLLETMDASTNWWKEALEALVEFGPLCDSQPVIDGCCSHIVSFKEELALTPAGHSADVALAMLLALQRTVGDHCGACSGLREHFVHELCLHIDGRISDGLFEVDPTCLTPGPAQGGLKRRRRIGEDWKTAIIDKMVQAKRAKTGAQALRVAGEIAPGVATRWERDSMLHYQAAGWRSFSGAKAIGISSDAARLGDSPEETLIVFLWEPGADLGMVAPPQAPFAVFGAVGGLSLEQARVQASLWRRCEKRLCFAKIGHFDFSLVFLKQNGHSDFSFLKNRTLRFFVSQKSDTPVFHFSETFATQQKSECPIITPLAGLKNRTLRFFGRPSLGGGLWSLESAAALVDGLG